jgi:hypothetical protein
MDGDDRRGSAPGDLSPPAQFDAAEEARRDRSGLPRADRGVEESMYFRDPNGVGLAYREEPAF